MDKSAWLARLVSVCAVTVLAGGALVVAPANADTRGATALSVATPDTSAVRGDVVTTRGEAVLTGLRITIDGVSPGGRANVTVTGPNQRSRAARVGKRYTKVIHRSATLRVRPGVYRVTSSSVAATGGTDVPKVAIKTLRVRKNRLTGFTVRYHFVASAPAACSAYAVGATGPGGGKVFYVASSPQSWGCYMEAVVAGMTPAWDDANVGFGYIWCVGPGQENNVTTATAIGAGKVNTDNMLAAGAGACTSGAATSVRAYTGGLGAGSWSLPSKDELDELYVQREMVGGFAAADYWSSSQDDAILAWGEALNKGFQGTVSKDNSLHVRPVRAF